MKITDLLKAQQHRPYGMPTQNWKYYQEWNNALFLHWAVPVETLRNVVPEGLSIDTFDGKAYVSLVAFTMQKIRPKYLPALSFVSDFHEINLRTYINNDGREGVYFLSIEAEKSLSAFLSRTLSGLPYRKSQIVRDNKTHKSTQSKTGIALHAEFEVGERVTQKTALDKWLTERYCLYVDNKKLLYRYEVHHKEWEIKDVKLAKLELQYKVGDFDLSELAPDFLHYSDGVEVVAWGREGI